MSRTLAGLLFWLPYFLVAELPAHFFSWWPWPTLSSTVWGGIKWWHPIAAMVTLFLFVLWGHLDRGWSAVWLIASGLLIAVAIGVHVAAR